MTNSTKRRGATNMTKFEVGDVIVGNDDERYAITRKGNGEGTVKSLVEPADGSDISVLWSDGSKYDVNSQYFDLKERPTKDKPTEATTDVDGLNRQLENLRQDYKNMQ